MLGQVDDWRVFKSLLQGVGEWFLEMTRLLKFCINDSGLGNIFFSLIYLLFFLFILEGEGVLGVFGSGIINRIFVRDC